MVLTSFLFSSNSSHLLNVWFREAREYQQKSVFRFFLVVLDQVVNMTFFVCFLVHNDAKDSGNMSDIVQGNGRIVGKLVLDLLCRTFLA